ncbi:MAG: DUF4346 domain-containing protein [Cyanobium sp.]
MSSTESISPGCSSRQALDDSLSQRFIVLDPFGYFLIHIDSQQQELVAEHYGNTIDERGLARDPETGEVIRCQGAEPRTPTAIYRGRTAKELGVLLTEGDQVPLSRLDHALYLGRELQKAERCLNRGEPYIQD